MIEVKGRGGISAKVIADSISESGKRITTFELIYPRFVHAEFLTHRLFSRNAASSRAIPVKKVIEQVENNPAKPIHWGKNQSGMQAKEELTGEALDAVQEEWKVAADNASASAFLMSCHEAHKQLVNRLLEPYQFIKVVCTATEFKNFFWLRCHEDAQPEIRALADCMEEAMWQSHPQLLQAGEWHLPYVLTEREDDGSVSYQIHSTHEGITSSQYLTLDEALKVSSSCCAQVSYRVLDESLEKAEKIYQQLVESEPVHASPFEHQATPVYGNGNIGTCMDDFYEAEEGITHIDRKGDIWSGNFKGWIQHRQIIKGHTKW